MAAMDTRQFRALRATGDPAEREALVARWMPLAQQLARRYSGSAETVEDLVQVAYIGLLKAIDRFDPEQGTQFSSFAVPTITGELKRHLRDHTWTLRVPRSTKDLSMKVVRTEAEIEASTGRSPTIPEVAEHLEATVEQVVDARLAMGSYRMESLDAPVAGEEEGLSRVDTLGAEDRGFDLVETGTMLPPLLSCIEPREREILRLRFVNDLTQQEIADRVGCSQMHVSRLIRTSLARMADVAG